MKYKEFLRQVEEYKGNNEQKAIDRSAAKQIESSAAKQIENSIRIVHDSFQNTVEKCEEYNAEKNYEAVIKACRDFFESRANEVKFRNLASSELYQSVHLYNIIAEAHLHSGAYDKAIEYASVYKWVEFDAAFINRDFLNRIRRLCILAAAYRNKAQSDGCQPSEKSEYVVQANEYLQSAKKILDALSGNNSITPEQYQEATNKVDSELSYVRALDTYGKTAEEKIQNYYKSKGIDVTKIVVSYLARVVPQAFITSANSDISLASNSAEMLRRLLASGFKVNLSVPVKAIEQLSAEQREILADLQEKHPNALTVEKSLKTDCGLSEFTITSRVITYKNADLSLTFDESSMNLTFDDEVFKECCDGVVKAL